MTEVFQAYILGLASRYRGELLEAELRKYDIEFSRIDAIEPIQLKELGIRWVKISPYLSIIPALTPGEICCSLGHKMIYNRILEAKHDWALVLEDDAILRVSPKLVNLGKLDSSVPTILQLSPDPTKLLISKDDSLIGYIPDPQIVQRKNPQLESCAYFINRAAACLILDSVSPQLITSRADWPLEASKSVQFMTTSVFCAYQIRVGGTSQIQGRGELAPRIPLLLRVVRGILRILGITSFFYKVQGASFRASYRVEVTNPMLERFRVQKC